MSIRNMFESIMSEDDAADRAPDEATANDGGLMADEPPIDDGGGDDLGGLGGLEDDGDELGGFDDDGFGEMEEAGGGDVDELEHRLDELEAEVGSLSSTVNTVRNENEQISESVGEVEENVRKLLDIYEMVTRGVNPFAEDIDPGVSGGTGSGDGFGLFDDDGGDGGEADGIDQEVAQADAEGFFEEDLVEDDVGSAADADVDDVFDETGGGEDLADEFAEEFEEEAEAFEEDVEAFEADAQESEADVEESTEADAIEADDTGDTGDDGGGGGTSFQDLKEEYESGDAEWAEDDFEDVADGDAEPAPDSAAEVDDTPEDAVTSTTDATDDTSADDALAEDDLFDEVIEAEPSKTDEPAPPADDEAAPASEGATDETTQPDSKTATTQADPETATTEPEPSPSSHEASAGGADATAGPAAVENADREPATGTGESLNGDGHDVRTAAGSGKPYLTALPAGYAADLLVAEWLEYLVEEAGVRETARALDYYESIEWLEPAVADHLETYLGGFDGGGDGRLTIDHHARSLRYISQLNGGGADALAASCLATGGGSDGIQR